MTPLILGVFVLVYLGMALGRAPRLEIDRTGFALLGALVLYVSGAVDGTAAIEAVDFPTLFVLFALMVLSAQFGVSGFYDWCASRLSQVAVSPPMLLAVLIAVAGSLSAVLANDVVVFAMTPMLCRGLTARGLAPQPFLIGLAGAANAGSAATIIGNPQNILIGEAGGLGFWPFAAACAPAAIGGLFSVWIVVRIAYRHQLHSSPAVPGAEPPPLDRQGLIKAIVATILLLILFSTPLPHVTSALIVTGGLMISRRWSTRDMLAPVDWPLLVLFASLFVVTAALSSTGLLDSGRLALESHGVTLTSLPVLAIVALIGSNTIGNVPAVILILAASVDLPAGTFYALAVLSTLAGNLFLTGSLANIIMVERARQVGVLLTFREHARCGVPIAMLSFALALPWLWFLGAS